MTRAMTIDRGERVLQRFAVTEQRGIIA